MQDRRPPCPDPDHYIWVITKEGSFWRRKRGTVKKVGLNEAFRKNSQLVALTSPAAARIVRTMRPYMSGLEVGRINVRVAGELRKDLSATGLMTLSSLQKFEWQPQHPLWQIMKGNPVPSVERDRLTVCIAIQDYTVKRLSPLVTDFYFELVLLYGDISEDNGLLTESTDSMVYAIEKKYKKDCVLYMDLPKVPWVAFLKINSIEGHTPAGASRHYAMRGIAGQGTEDRGQRTEDRGQGTEDKGQLTGDSWVRDNHC